MHGNGNRNRPAAGADIGYHDRPAGSVADLSKHKIDKQLRLRTGNQNAPVHREFQPVEFLAAQQIGNRFSPPAPRYQFCVTAAVPVAEFMIVVGKEPTATLIQDMCKQHLRIQPCRLAARFTQPLRSRNQGAPDRCSLRQTPMGMGPGANCSEAVFRLLPRLPELPALCPCQVRGVCRLRSGAGVRLRSCLDGRMPNKKSKGYFSEAYLCALTCFRLPRSWPAAVASGQMQPDQRSIRQDRHPEPVPNGRGSC